MAKKNEILLSIALEGDADIKAKLKAVGDEGKRSLADMQRDLGRARDSLGRVGDAAAPLRRTFAPLTGGGAGGGGLLGELGGLGSLVGLGGLLRGLGGALTSPGGLLAGLGGALLSLAKIGEETDRQKGRLKGLGDAGGFGKLADQAKKRGENVSDLQPGYEKFLDFQQRQRAENPTLIGPVDPSADGVRTLTGGVNRRLPSRGQYSDFDRALSEEIRRDVGDKDQARAIAEQFKDSLYQNRELSGDAVRALYKASPNAGNFVIRSLAPMLALSPGGSSNPEELAAAIDRGHVRVGAGDVIGEGARAAPEADREAEAARGVTEALGGLEAALKRLAEGLGGDHANLAKGIDGAAKLVDQEADQVDKSLHPAGPRGTAPQSVGEVFSSDNGDLLGRIVGFIRSGSQAGPGGSNPFGAITDFLTKALTNPGAIQGNTPQPLPPIGQQPLLTPDGNGGFSNAPAQSQQPAERQSGIFQQLMESIAAAVNKPENTKVEGPSSGLGIRGDASDQIKDAGAQLALAIADVAAGIKNSATVAPEKAQAAAGGGWIRRLIGGGGVSGPGTSTSDSIPAMLSNGEYVVKAATVRKAGLNFMDAFNAGKMFADGGVANDDGSGYIEDAGYQYFYKNAGERKEVQKALDAQHKAEAWENQQRARSGHSWFVGRFGHDDSNGAIDSYVAKGGLIGHFAGGGAVGNILNRSVSFPGLAHFADGGMADISSLTGSFPGIADGGAAGGLSGHMSVDLRTNHGDFRMMTSEETAKQLSAAARDAALFQTGRRPGWYSGK